MSSPAPVSPTRPTAALAAALQPPGRHDLRPTERRALIAAVAGAHLLLMWAVLQLDVVRQALLEPAPLTVDIVSLEPELPTQAPPPPPRPAVAPRPVPAPLMATPAPSPAPTSFTAPEPVPAPAAAPASPTAVATPAPAPQPAPAPPASPKLVPASAVRYLLPPPLEVPMASRRLGESGTVLLRVLVDAAGHPKQITLHRSSGFARLDEQAIAAMRQARFKPQTENGVAIEWQVIAPLQYEIE